MLFSLIVKIFLSHLLSNLFFFDNFRIFLSLLDLNSAVSRKEKVFTLNLWKFSLYKNVLLHLCYFCCVCWFFWCLNEVSELFLGWRRPGLLDGQWNIFPRCVLFFSAFYACNFNLSWEVVFLEGVCFLFEEKTGDWERNVLKEKCGKEVMWKITDFAITTHPDLRHLGSALFARLHHHPAYLMSKESSCL